MRLLFSLVASVFVGGPVSAQAERYELGQRLKAFEKQWDKTTDEKSKKKAAEGLTKLTALFFTNQFGEAGRTLDEARWILEGKEPSDDEKWAESLYVVPETRYVVVPQHNLAVRIRAFYSVKSPMPKNLSVQMTGLNRFTVELLPMKNTSSLPTNAGDFTLFVWIRLGEKTVVMRQIGMSTEGREIPRDNDKEKFPEPDPVDTAADAMRLLPRDSLEWATARDRRELFEKLIKGEAAETDMPAWKMHQQLKHFIVLNQDNKECFIAERPGDFHLSISTGKTTTPARLFVPKPPKFLVEGTNPKIPLVIALHGAGGTENMFFEGYGDGQILKLCRERGWMLVAPRSALSLVGGGPPVGEIIDELVKRYPIDPKAIFIVGHSMGAMQAIDAVQKYPGKFAGLAAFGGDGRIRKPELFAALPTFIGVGDKDFTLARVRKLKKTLDDAKAKAMTYKEYEGLEHLLIVREALPDAFAMFDTIVK